MLSFYLQHGIECVCDGDSCVRWVIGLEVGGSLVQPHADIEVPFFDHELHQPERKGKLMSTAGRQELSQARSAGTGSSRFLTLGIFPLSSTALLRVGLVHLHYVQTGARAAPQCVQSSGGSHRHAGQ